MERIPKKLVMKGMKSDPLRGQNAGHADKMLTAMKRNRISLHTKSIKSR